MADDDKPWIVKESEDMGDDAREGLENNAEDSDS